MQNPLDNLENIKKIDTKDMLSIIEGFTESAKKTITDARKFDLTGISGKKIKALIIAGMGGSAVGGLLLRDWLYKSSKVPIEVSRDYSLPSWVDDETMVFVVSYSGNTEETLSQFREALERKCPIVCFTSGGELKELANQKGIPVFVFSVGYQPRAAIAFQFFSIATVSKRLGLIGEETWEEVDEAIKVLKNLRKDLSPNTPLKKNPAKSLALSIKDHIPFVLGNTQYMAVAYRYSTQFNENSKSLAAASFLPEAFHNSVMAREANSKLIDRCCIVLIHDHTEDERHSNKIERFMTLMSESFGRIVEVKPIGRSRLSRMLSALLIGDYASVYLGILYGHDPSTTESINLLKESNSK
jgi:glucose/mannose-6-phosphate isomerase